MTRPSGDGSYQIELETAQAPSQPVGKVCTNRTESPFGSNPRRLSVRWETNSRIADPGVCGEVSLRVRS